MFRSNAFNFNSNNSNKLFSKVFLSQAFIILTSLLIVGLTSRYFFKRQFISQVELQLTDSLITVSNQISDKMYQPTLCSNLSTNTRYRFTLIDSKGVVLCDSHADTKVMENHLTRPEVIQAIQNGTGYGLRKSNSIHEDMVYGAIYIKNYNLILRAGITIHNLSKLLKVFDLALLIISGILGSILTLYAIRSTKAILKPIGQLESSLESLKKDYAEQEENILKERFEQAAIMSSISDAILAINLEGKPLFYNSNFALLTEYSVGIADKHYTKLFDHRQIIESISIILNNGKPQTLSSLPFETENGLKYFSLSGSPLYKKNGDRYGAVIIFHDVTELKKAEQMRINFVANVSHELRTPLTAIKGFTDTIIQDQKDQRPVFSEHLDIIKRNSDRLLSLITDLLDLSSMESGLKINGTWINLKETTDFILSNLSQSIRSKHQTVKTYFEIDKFFADQRKVEQILTNLISNSNKYAPDNSIISIYWKSLNDSSVLIVHDNGLGIPNEHLPNLFERFYRVDKSRSRDQGGTGLGLAIVKHIMISHGGSISVASEYGKGITFTCEFPIHSKV